MATARRDTLLELQASAQKKWADDKTFEVSAPRDGTYTINRVSTNLRSRRSDTERFLHPTEVAAHASLPPSTSCHPRAYMTDLTSTLPPHNTQIT